MKTSKLASRWLCNKAFSITLFLSTLSRSGKSRGLESTRESLPVCRCRRYSDWAGRCWKRCSFCEIVAFHRMDICTAAMWFSRMVWRGTLVVVISLRASELVNRYSICYILISLSFAPSLSSTAEEGNGNSSSSYSHYKYNLICAGKNCVIKTVGVTRTKVQFSCLKKPIRTWASFPL